MRFLLFLCMVGIVLAGVVTLDSRSADADHDKVGNHLSVLLGGPWIARNIVLGNPIDICTGQYPTSTQAAITRWNNKLGTVFHYAGALANCAEAQPDPALGIGSAIVQRDVNSVECRLGVHGCTFYSRGARPDRKWKTFIEQHEIYIGKPQLSDETVSATFYADGHAAVTRTITHELGHVLSLANYTGCDTNAAAATFTTANARSVMTFTRGPERGGPALGRTTALPPTVPGPTVPGHARCRSRRSRPMTPAR